MPAAPEFRFRVSLLPRQAGGFRHESSPIIRLLHTIALGPREIFTARRFPCDTNSSVRTPKGKYESRPRRTLWSGVAQFANYRIHASSRDHQAVLRYYRIVCHYSLVSTYDGGVANSNNGRREAGSRTSRLGGDAEAAFDESQLTDNVALASHRI